MEGQVPHLILNKKGWKRLERDWHIDNATSIADFIGLTPAEVSDVVDGKCYPNARFVAACLSELPVRFEDLFEVVPPRPLLVTAAA
jgi:hypothetical protein